MNTTVLRTKVQLEKEKRLKMFLRVTIAPFSSAKLGFKSEFEIYHLPLEPSVRTDGQTRAAGIWREKGGLEEKNGLSILQRKNGTSLRERPIISEEWVVTTERQVFTGLPACLRAADTDLDLWADGDLDWVGAEHEVFARSETCRFDVDEWWPSLCRDVL